MPVHPPPTLIGHRFVRRQSVVPRSRGLPGSEPDRGAARLNRLLLTKSSGERYASLFWCAYDPGSGVLQHLNAGHPPPIWMRRGPEGSWTVERLTRGGPVLGLLNSASYDTTSIEVLRRIQAALDF